MIEPKAHLHPCNPLGHLILLLLFCTIMAAPAQAEGPDYAGALQAQIGTQRTLLSALSSHYQVSINGDIANVRVRQTYTNPYDQPIDATYLFPLNSRAAVHAMTMRVGDEVISAEIQEKKQAQQTFTRAKQQGKAAALLEQHRPNMFTQKVANLMPGLPIEVEIEYAQIVPKIDGAYELVVPMVVGPRFQPPGSATAAGQPQEDLPAEGLWSLQQLPAYPPTAGIDIPASIASERVRLQIDMDMPMAIASAISTTHRLAVRTTSSTQQTMTLADQRTIDNRDFVLRYGMGGPAADMGLLSDWQGADGHTDAGGYFSLLIEPPSTASEAAALPREMVFLLDCSGSMNGQPMQASKLFMRHALQQLRPFDTFRIIRFSDNATEFSRAPLPATPANIQRGLAYTQSLYGSGGTMMTSGISQALSGPSPDGALRNVIFLTDGYIGNEATVLRLVDQLRGRARLYAFGVGSGVNRYLLDELGRVGRGFSRYFDPTTDSESMQAIARNLAARLHTPVLTDLRIDWGGLPVTDVYPSHLPDLYAGDSIRVTGRFAEPGTGRIRLSGAARNESASLIREVNLADHQSRPLLRRLWAKAAVTDRMHQLITPPQLRPDGVSNEALRQQVTQLGLEHGLTTRWTSFVAVSRKIINNAPEQNLEAAVALPKVAGVSPLAYPQPAMTGYAAPEPGMVVGLLAVLAALLISTWRKPLHS